jgi:serine/threonine-protein kinase
VEVGLEFSHYRVIEHIGRGGMADVWSARDRRLSRTVAIKTIGRDLASEMDPMALFEREAQTIAGLEHPHILPIYEFGELEKQLYIVMRYVSGGSLDGVLDRGAMPLSEVLRLARAVGQALEYAHDSKVIHLDLKPSNILLDSYQSPYLADFGLAAVLGPEGRASNPGSGTLLYMAPEQITSDQLDSRADIYSFGVMLFHMITGDLPFNGAQPLAIKQLQMRENLPDITRIRRDVPAALNVVLQTSTALEPGKRFISMDEMVYALETAIQAAASRRPTPPAADPGGLLNATGARPRETGPLTGDLLTGSALASTLPRDVNTLTDPGRLGTNDPNERETRPYETMPGGSAPGGSAGGMVTRDLSGLLAGDSAMGDGLLKRTGELPAASSGPASGGLTASGGLATRDLSSLLAGDSAAGDGLLKRTGEFSAPPALSDLDAKTRDLGAFLAGGLGEGDSLLTRTGELPKPPMLDPEGGLKTRDLSDLISAPIEKLLSRTGALPAAEQAPLSPEEAARREAEDIYTRARRAWARGQGKFTLGVTDFILISDFYSEAARHQLSLDEAGMQMFLRGALEYETDLEYWWGKVAEDDRRWALLHAVRSENAPARTRALHLLVGVRDAETPQIPKLVAQALQSERDHAAQLAALSVLEARARVP